MALANLEVFEEERTLERLKPKIEHLTKRLEEFWELEHVGEATNIKITYQEDMVLAEAIGKILGYG